MKAKVLQGNVFDLLPALSPGSVDCVVTSPPYWRLRSYLPKDHPEKAKELGNEATPAEYVANMVRVFALVRKALADHGTVWLNVGDSYNNDASNGQGRGGSVTSAVGGGDPAIGREHKLQKGLPSGSLCLIPQRLAIALQDDGWLCRSVVVWHKPAPMPSSVAGWRWRRCRVKVRAQKNAADAGKYGVANRQARPGSGGVTGKMPPEYQAEWSDCPGCPKCAPHGGYVLRRGSWRPTSAWEPILMLAKAPHYYCDGEAVKTPAAEATLSRNEYTRMLDDPDEQFAVWHDHETICDAGANLRDVWTIGPEPLKEKHYASFPTALVEKCLRAGTSAHGYCSACGAPWARVIERERVGSWHDHDADGVQYGGRQNGKGPAHEWPPTQTLGWRTTCACPPAEPRPGLVLDPFCGSCRTGIAAGRLGLDFVGCELNEVYVDMARRVLAEQMPLFMEV